MSSIRIDPIRSKHLMVAVIALSVVPTWADADGLSEPCAKPVVPVSVTVETAEIYRDLIRADYDAYFAAASIYVSCLDTERAGVLSDLSKAVQDYQAFLAIPVLGASR